MKTAIAENINPHECQRAVCVRNTSHAEAEKRGKIDQTLGIANTTMWKRNKPLILTSRHDPGQPRKQQQLMTERL